jgi:nicotinamidase-related amidase
MLNPVQSSEFSSAMADTVLPYGPLGTNAVHLCVDMQRMFAEATDWHTPWMARVRPAVHRIASRFPERTIFTRFIPVDDANQARGSWRRYYERWASMTQARLGRERVQLVPELAALVPPAEVLDKCVYSPWMTTDLEQRLRRRSADALVITGGETDVCVIATVLGAVDRGYRAIVVTDALCSSADETHDAALRLYQSRFGQQVETASVGAVLSVWR